MSAPRIIMGASTTADISMIYRRSKAYFYEKIDVVYEDNRDKLRFTIKVKMHLRFTRNGRLRIYEDNKFPFTVYEDNKSAFTVYEDTPLAPSNNIVAVTIS